VRFIDGTCAPHLDLESAIAAFTGRPAARIFNSAYTTTLGTGLTLTTPRT
jgi:glycine C-acetyltransferase